MSIAGRTLGNYFIHEVIGKGGMGVVYAAQHRFFGDRVAVKVLHPSYAAMPDLVKRFFREARLTNTIEHPNVVKVIDFGKDDAGDGSLYLVLEMLDGKPLSRLIAAEGRLDEQAAARIGLEVARGLGAAHDKGIIHRDLKPDNVFLCLDRRVKLLDFGIAKLLGGSAQLTGVSDVLGTPAYMAPEQALKNHPAGTYTDVYALGAVLFKMVTGQAPFASYSVAERVEQIHHRRTPRPSAVVPISAAMEGLILRCLVHDPTARPPIAEVRGELEAILARPATAEAEQWAMAPAADPGDAASEDDGADVTPLPSGQTGPGGDRSGTDVAGSTTTAPTVAERPGGRRPGS